MADLTRIQFKRSKTPNVRPVPDTVAEGEIILNLADRAILTKLGNEIIDLGFAKGGKVDGNIDLTGNFDQKNGNIVTTGSITVNQESTINAPFNINANIKIKNPNKPGDFGTLVYATGKLYYEQFVDGKWTGQFIIPQGAGTAASREWVNKLIYLQNEDIIIQHTENSTSPAIILHQNDSLDIWSNKKNKNLVTMNEWGGLTLSAQLVATDEVCSVTGETRLHLKTSNGTPELVFRKAGGGWTSLTLPTAEKSETIASREWVNVWLRNGVDNTETILQARENPGESFMFLRSNDHNIGFSLQGSTKFRITPTAITTETGCRTFVINGTDNSTSNRPQLILDSKADLWRMEPDGAGKLQLTHPASGALYEFEKTGGTQQVASKQWVSNSNQTYNETMNLKAGNGSGSPITLRNWGSGDRKNVFEVGDTYGYFFYAQRKRNNTIEFNVNGPIFTNDQAVATQQWVNTNYHSNLAINNISGSWITMRDQPCFRSGNPVSTDSASCILRQEHQDRHFMIGGLGNREFGIYMINKNQVANGTNGRAWMDQNGGWNCNDGYAATQQWVNAQGFSKRGGYGVGDEYLWKVSKADHDKSLTLQNALTGMPSNVMLTRIHRHSQWHVDIYVRPIV